jgi:hypothetical protein
MDFTEYYQDQAQNNGLQVFKGSMYQRGYGFGDVFRKFFRWIVPIIKKNATPVLQNVGKEIVKSASNIANETIEGKNFKDSFDENIARSMRNIEETYGKGYKRKKKIEKTSLRKKIKNLRDIFH